MPKNSGLYLIVCLTFSGCVTATPDLDTEDPETDVIEEEVAVCVLPHEEATIDQLAAHGADIFGYSANYLRGPRDCGGQRVSRSVAKIIGTGSCDLVVDPAQSIFWANELCAVNPNMRFGNSTITEACQEFFNSGSDLGDQDCRYIVHIGAGQYVPPFQPANDTLCQPSHVTRVPGDCPPPSLNYSASNTNSAQQNTVNQVVTLAAGDTITLGTCGLTGATFTGDTYLRFIGPGGSPVAFNDDACGGLGSNLTFTAATAGNYEIRGGCFSSGSCTGTLVMQIIAGLYNFSASNTNSAQQNTVNRNVAINAGQSITLGTCGVAGGNFTGDTYLRLFGPALTQVAADDDACGGLGSNLTYTATATGTYQLRAGCFSSASCSGTVAWTVH